LFRGPRHYRSLCLSYGLADSSRHARRANFWTKLIAHKSIQFQAT
jgi:hypothetical protein